MRASTNHVRRRDLRPASGAWRRSVVVLLLSGIVVCGGCRKAGEGPTSIAPSPAPHSGGSAAARGVSSEAVVEVFYATNRRGSDRMSPTWRDYLLRYRLGAMALLAAATLAFGLRAVRGSEPAWIKYVALVAVVYFAVTGTLDCFQLSNDARRSGRTYGGDRGELELGTTEVSIPRRHRAGELESPSILRLEFRENPERHVILLSTTSVSESDFYDRLGRRIEESPNREVFVFIHGYNVGFPEAVRRAAQIAYDLPFSGVPVVFSWPSQESMLGYAVDETNVEWAALDLERFLARVAGQFRASRVNLIAHSMGNRALMSALRSLAARRTPDEPFREIVLAAPDVDAEVFRRDFAPIVAASARHVTLYASTNDEALKASMQVHGFPRAGDAGERIVVAPDIDTIDVSSVDMSLLGHSYYGSNVNVLEDLFHLLVRGRATHHRVWLQPATRDGLHYWVLDSSRLEAAANETRGAPNE